MFTFPQETENMWLSSTASCILLTLQPYLGQIWSMGEDLPAVQSWSTSAFPICSPVVLVAHLPWCISTIMQPHSWPIHVPHRSFPTSKCVSRREFLSWLLAESLPPRIEVLKLVTENTVIRKSPWTMIDPISKGADYPQISVTPITLGVFIRSLIKD